MNEPLDKRLTPARPDLAAEHLRGKVEAARFVAGQPMRVIEEAVELRPAPQRDQSINTQAIFGERVIAYEIDEEGWAWCQLERDSYVGYLPAEALRNDSLAPTHRVRTPRTFVYTTANMKSPVLMALPLGAEVCVTAMQEPFARLASGGFVWAEHLAAQGQCESDFVRVAERFLDVPYLWGGKTFAGLDCSGLIQIALGACGVTAPRDTDMMVRALGEELTVGDDLKFMRRGDLVFWKGHIGVMRDADTLLHANGHHMMVASEPLIEARDRILEKSFGAITSVRRL